MCELDTFGIEKLSKRRVWFYLARHEGVKLAGRTRILGKFFLDNVLDHFPAVGNIINLLGMGCGDYHGAILIPNDRVTGADNYTSTVNHGVAGPGLMDVRSLPWGGRVRKDREAIFSEDRRVTDGTIGD
jgi:hypothetical protein